MVQTRNLNSGPGASEPRTSTSTSRGFEENPSYLLIRCQQIEDQRPAIQEKTERPLLVLQADCIGGRQPQVAFNPADSRRQGVKMLVNWDRVRLTDQTGLGAGVFKGRTSCAARYC
ncbi:hypothetical protein AAHC03_04533 [Spirometra sp. Aus1]